MEKLSEKAKAALARGTRTGWMQDPNSPEYDELLGAGLVHDGAVTGDGYRQAKSTQ